MYNIKVMSSWESQDQWWQDETWLWPGKSRCPSCHPKWDKNPSLKYLSQVFYLWNMQNTDEKNFLMHINLHSCQWILSKSDYQKMQMSVKNACVIRTCAPLLCITLHSFRKQMAHSYQSMLVKLLFLKTNYYFMNIKFFIFIS